jgi:hypothetical protein
MKPSAAHEGFLTALTRIIGAFANRIGHDQFIYNINTSLNKGLYYRKSDGSQAVGIPDFQLVIENNSPFARGLRQIPKWIGEVCFTVSSSDTRVHLKQLVDALPNVDLAFLITIVESPKWRSPSSENTHAMRLRSQPFLEYDDFIPDIPTGTLGPVIVEEINWISVSRVNIEVYLRRPDGTLIIDANGRDNHSACGVRLNSALFTVC